MTVKIVEGVTPEAWEGGISCTACEVKFTFSGHDLRRANSTTVYAYINCPGCKKSYLVGRDQLPGWLWAQLRISF